MKDFVIATIAVMAWDLLAKLWRLYSGNTSYPGFAAIGDGIVCAAMAGWGIWVLVSTGA